MNFISWKDSGETQVELKYCERCGGLWLRPRGTHQVHCASCRARLAARPEPGEQLSRRRRNTEVAVQASGLEPEGIPSPACIDHLQGVAVMEARV